jgi:hypothetical protein
MQAGAQYPKKLQDALDGGVLHRLPITFLPFVNQQLRDWDHLFPNERQSTERLLIYASGLTPSQSEELFRSVVDLEEKMGVRRWQFSTSEQTIENSSKLASSGYFQEWRRAVQAVFDAAEAHERDANSTAIKPNRLVLLDIPHPLPVYPANPWGRWNDIGTPVKLDLGAAGNSRSSFEYLLAGDPGLSAGSSVGLLNTARNRAHSSTADIWIVDGGKNLSSAILAHATSSPADEVTFAVLLSYERLDPLRQQFSHEMNTMRKDLTDADEVLDRLRKVDVTSKCPPEVAADTATREFVRSLYLSGNGAVIFANSFVEWASSEAFRRARPSFLAARFGTRTKPKPFTGVAVFDDPDKINPLPAVEDLPGSAIDAQILALYAWLAATRYDEYRTSTLCVCLAESLSEAYIVAPQGFAFRQPAQALPLDQLRSELCEWIT